MGTIRYIQSYFDELGEQGRAVLADVLGPAPWTFAPVPVDPAGCQRAAVVHNRHGERAFVKWAVTLEGYVRVNREARITEALAAFLPEGSPQIRRAAHGVLVADAVDGTRSVGWDEATVRTAAERLARLAAAPLSLIGEGNPVVVSTELDAWIAILAEYVPFALAERLGELGSAGFAEADRRAGNGDRVVAHMDAWPANWLSTTSGPVLVDYEHPAPAPAGWDAAWCLAQLPAPGPLRWEVLSEYADADFAIGVAHVLLIRHLKKLFSRDRSFVETTIRPLVWAEMGLLAAAGDDEALELAHAVSAIASAKAASLAA
jgi:hypothetical protein